MPPAEGHESANGAIVDRGATVPPTREEFIDKVRGQFLLFLTEAWAVRNEPPSKLGMTMDRHHAKLRHLLDRVYDMLVPRAEKYPVVKAEEKKERGGVKP
jgi:hypothetical protein